MSNNVYEVIKHINQIASEVYDGGVKPGFMEFENGDPVWDKRLIDGFGVTFRGSAMRISYNSQVSIQDIGDGYENRVKGMIADIVKYLKKEYTKRGFGSLSLKPVDNFYARVESITYNDNRIVAWQDFIIQNVQDTVLNEVFIDFKQIL